MCLGANLDVGHVISHAFWSALGLGKIQSQGMLKGKREFQAFRIFTPDTREIQRTCKTENNFLWGKTKHLLVASHPRSNWPWWPSSSKHNSLGHRCFPISSVPSKPTLLECIGHFSFDYKQGTTGIQKCHLFLLATYEHCLGTK